jgi:serine/threonine protein kinase
VLILQHDEINELRKRKAGLEHAALMMAAEGVAVPPEISEELNRLVRSLAGLSESLSQTAWTSFLGEEIEGFVLNERLSSGTYSHVFKGVHEKSGEICVIKIARTSDPIIANPDDYFSKQAIRFHLELCQYVDISPNNVLQHESERLQSDRSGHFVKVLSNGMHNDLFYYRMPFIEGTSVKSFEELTSDFSQFTSINLDIFERLCTVLDDFFLLTPAQYHGNLQPDAIMFTKSEFVLLSPGIFEMPDPSNPDQPSISITTPAYYPFFEKNDLFALGVTFWESICRENPFDVKNNIEREALFSNDLKEALDYRKALIHSPLWHILKLKLPREIRSELSMQTESILLKALKLEMNKDGYLTATPGFTSATEFGETLNDLATNGLLAPQNNSDLH